MERVCRIRKFITQRGLGFSYRQGISPSLLISYVIRRNSALRALTRGSWTAVRASCAPLWSVLCPLRSGGLAGVQLATATLFNGRVLARPARPGRCTAPAPRPIRPEPYWGNSMSILSPVTSETNPIRETIPTKCYHAYGHQVGWVICCTFVPVELRTFGRSIPGYFR